MSYRYLRLFAASAIACFSNTAARAAPFANLPLTCSSASAIGQPQNNCTGDWVYLLPNTDELVVLKGPASAPTWARAANVASSETVAVCSLPVEPGGYSGCKDASGVRRIVYLPKIQVFLGSPSPPLPPPPSGARTLDLSRTPVEITEQGVYVPQSKLACFGSGTSKWSHLNKSRRGNSRPSRIRVGCGEQYSDSIERASRLHP